RNTGGAASSRTFGSPSSRRPEMRRVIIGCLSILASLGPGSAWASTVYPIDRAQILAGSHFDFKVEFDGIVRPGNVQVTVNGEDAVGVFGQSFAFVEREPGVEASALLLRNVSLATPGRYLVSASDGQTTTTVAWDVYATGPRQARNVILFIGDGMSVAH